MVCCDGLCWFVIVRYLLTAYHLAGLVVKASASRAEDPGFESRLRRDFSGSSHTSDFKIGTLVATLPCTRRYRVSAGTGRPGVSITCVDEVAGLISSVCVCVAARTMVCMLHVAGTLAANQPTHCPWEKHPCSLSEHRSNAQISFPA